MNYKELKKYIKENIKLIYSDFTKCFNLEEEQFKLLITNLIYSFENNDYLKNKIYSLNIFSIQNLENLLSNLMNLDLKNTVIKEIITKSPIILLYSNQLDNIYFLYKNNKYYGYIILDNNKYYTYLYNPNINSNIVSNNYILDKMLEYHKINTYEKETIYSMIKIYKLKNYYLKK